MDLLSWTFESEVSNIDNPILIDSSNTNRSLSFRQIRTQVKKLVAGLHSVGVGAGDCVLVNCFNDISYYVLYLGIMGSGGIFSGVNPGYTVSELVHHLKLTKPKLLIVEPDLVEKITTAAQEAGLSEKAIYVFDVQKKNESSTHQSWEELLQHGEKDWVKIPEPATAIAQYASTSGTSGLPKAALLPHSYLVDQAELQRIKSTLPYPVRRLTGLPPFHAFALPIVPASIRQGHPIYIIRRFGNEDSFIELVKRFGITETYLPPPIIVSLPRNPKCTNEMLGSIRQLWFGGASLKHKNRLPLLESLHKDAKIQPVWGMTEIGWITAGRWTESIDDDSVGWLLDGFEAKIDKDDDQDLGEIIVRSSSMMLGYLDNEKATREAFDSNGWLRTGDVGRLEGGKVFVFDRKKDLIKVRTWQVSPAEVESVLLQHPEILDAGVIGVELPDGSGESPRAYVVAKPGASVTEEGIKSFAREKLAKYKIPEEILFVESIPKNGTGKILRRVLREEAKGRSSEATTAKGGDEPEKSAPVESSESKNSVSGWIHRCKSWFRSLSSL